MSSLRELLIRLISSTSAPPAPVTGGNLQKAREIYRASLQGDFGPPRGCTPVQISNLETRLGRPLPAAYREYLAWMGNDQNGALRGSNWFWDDVEPNTGYLPDLLNENGIQSTECAQPICFFMHQGYIACWFDLGTPDADPPCYFFSEADKTCGIEQIESFSEFLAGHLRGLRESQRKAP